MNTLPRRRDDKIAIISQEIRSELRRIIRKYNELTRPLQLFRVVDTRPDGAPKYQVCFDLYPHEPTGSGLRMSSKKVCQPDERLQDLVYDFAGSVWHLKDRLHAWGRARSLLYVKPKRIEDHAKDSPELLITADLITRKKHAAHENRSGIDPCLDVIQLDTSASGRIEYWYNGAVKETILLVTDPTPIPFCIDICEGNGLGQPKSDPPLPEERIGNAANVIWTGFRHWIPLIKEFKIFTSGDPEYIALAAILGAVGLDI